MTQTKPQGSRLPVVVPTREDRRREILGGLISLLAIMAVVIGVPVALLVFVGSPLPKTAPSTDWLTAEITGDVVLRVISDLVWLAWAHFVACLLVEWRAGRRGHGLPRSVFMGGGSQQLARKLVAAVLLLAGTATLVPQATSALPLERPTAATSTVQAGQQAEQASLQKIADAATVGASAVTTVESYKYYEVQPPEGRHHDCLWDIAERHLGDPLRYRELFALNKDRVQPDGRTITDADLIRPGYILRMPADASGPGVRSVDPIAAPGAAARASAEAVASTGSAATRAAAEAGTTGATVDRTTAQVTAPSDDGGSSYGFGRLGVGGGLLAAGLLVALTGRRGPYGAGTNADAERRLRLAADPGLAGFMDNALRGLAAALAAESRSMPEAYAAFLRADELVLHFSPVPDAAPPGPWVQAEDGRAWKVASADVTDAFDGVLAPYPALVNVGVSHGYEVLVDLEAAPGLVSIGGDTGAARAIASSVAIELGTNLWSDDVAVTLVGFGDDLTSVAPGRLTVAASLGAVLDAAEADAPRTAALLRSLGVNGVLQGRAVRDQGWALRPQVLVLSAPPSESEATRLNALVGAGRGRFAALCVGDSAGARWRFTAGGKGQLDLGILGFAVDAHRLDPADYGSLLTLLADADRTRAEAAEELPGLTPRAALVSTTALHVVSSDPGDDKTPPPGAPALLPLPLDPDGVAAVDVQLLGPVVVAAPGPVAPERRDLLTEIVVAAALHADGLHDAVLRASVWPRGVEDDVVDAAVKDAQEWLGRTSDGSLRLRRSKDGRWELATDVRCDWQVLRSVAAATDDPREAERLAAVLHTVRGSAFSATPPGRYAWLQFHQAARDARIVGTASARRLSALAAARGDVTTAEWALRRGLALVPASEVLWRDLLRLLGGDDPSTASQLAGTMYAALATAGVARPEAQTDALVDQLVPGFRTTTA